MDTSRLRRVSVEEIEPTDGEAGDVELLEPLEDEERRERDRRVAAMRDHGAWFLAGQEVAGPKYLAIGRSTYYIPFLKRIAVELGAPVFQSDFLDWVEPTHPHASLLFCIRTAERIDVNLEGVSLEDLHAATVGAGALAQERGGPGLAYMTSWEINQLYYNPPDVPVFWHTGGSMTHEQAWDVLRQRIHKEYIVED